MLGKTLDFHRSLLRWYRRHRRDLPWRVAKKTAKVASWPDPYRVLVSEAMLQQTQVSTVIPYFNRFMAAYPTLGDLAAANEQEILRLWQGLGYYSRARNLLRTAKVLVVEENGTIPSSVEELLKLPGIGRYTAGAIASLAYEKRAPILDGNVARVLCRLDRRSTSGASFRESLWTRAEELLPDKHIGDFNSALMELGATICTPRAPRCLLCPVQKHCAALAANVVDQIPSSPAKKARPIERRLTLAINKKDAGQESPTYLIEQRPARGRWASMWQFITLEADDENPTAESLSQRVGLRLCNLRHLGSLQHDLTHRRYQFQVVSCRARPSRKAIPANRRWVGLAGLSDFPLPRPQLEVAQMISSIIRG